MVMTALSTGTGMRADSMSPVHLTFGAARSDEACVPCKAETAFTPVAPAAARAVGATAVVVDLPKPILTSFQLPPNHHPTPPRTLSRTLRLMTHPTVRRKRANAAKIKSRSYQSARSMALTSWADVPSNEV